jgi:hypothetical protein
VYGDRIAAIILEIENNHVIKFHEGERTYYDFDDKKIYIGYPPTEANFLHELIHYVQDFKFKNLDYDNSSLNNEYEAQWLSFAISIINDRGCNTSMHLGLKDENACLDIYIELVDYVENGRVKDKIFYDKLATYAVGHELEYREQQKSYDKEGKVIDNSYTHSFTTNYVYNWKERLNELGF